MNGNMYTFLPVVEPKVGQEVFLPTDPWEMLKSGEFEKVPLMIGLNLDETAFMANGNYHFFSKRKKFCLRDKKLR